MYAIKLYIKIKYRHEKGWLRSHTLAALDLIYYKYI